MTLFHKYYSRKLLFAVDVLAALKGAGSDGLTRTQLNELALRYGIQNPLCEQLLALMDQGALIEYNRTQKVYRLLADRISLLPLSNAEESYLQEILRLPQAALFLPPDLTKKLTNPQAEINFDSIQAMEALGEAQNPALSQPEFCRILEAIVRGCAVSYRFRVRNAEAPREACAIPWRLEYSPYDNRWWVILYHPEEKRCIKAWLSNLSDIVLERQITVPEKEILDARRKALMPEPVVLRVQDAKNALERCFLVLEQKQFEDSKLFSDGSVTIRFRYYRYEEQEILRQLLFLGPNVQLLAPKSLRVALLKQVDQALLWFGNG